MWSRCSLLDSECWMASINCCCNAIALVCFDVLLPITLVLFSKCCSVLHGYNDDLMTQEWYKDDGTVDLLNLWGSIVSGDSLVHLGPLGTAPETNAMKSFCISMHKIWPKLIQISPYWSNWTNSSLKALSIPCNQHQHNGIQFVIFLLLFMMVMMMTVMMMMMSIMVIMTTIVTRLPVYRLLTIVMIRFFMTHDEHDEYDEHDEHDDEHDDDDDGVNLVVSSPLRAKPVARSCRLHN